MDFSKHILLENNRVRLIPLKLQHIDTLLHFSEGEPELWQYSLQPANGKENLTQYIQSAIQSRKEEKSYAFVVFDKKFNEYAGSTRFYDFSKHHQTTQLGFTWFGEKYQKTGLNKNCKFLMLQFAFEKLKLARVEFRADATNFSSIKSMRGIGCVEEGILRSNCVGGTKRRDSIVLSILKNEWENTVNTNLIKQLNRYENN